MLVSCGRRSLRHEIKNTSQSQGFVRMNPTVEFLDCRSQLFHNWCCCFPKVPDRLCSSYPHRCLRIRQTRRKLVARRRSKRAKLSKRCRGCFSHFRLTRGDMETVRNAPATLPSTHALCRQAFSHQALLRSKRSLVVIVIHQMDIVRRVSINCHLNVVQRKKKKDNERKERS